MHSARKTRKKSISSGWKKDGEREKARRCKGNLKETIQNLTYPSTVELPDPYKTLPSGLTEGVEQASIPEMKDMHLKHVDTTRANNQQKWEAVP